jgi:hypothetical protein
LPHSHAKKTLKNATARQIRAAIMAIFGCVTQMHRPRGGERYGALMRGRAARFPCALKIAYDLALLFSFRHIKPPEET